MWNEIARHVDRHAAQLSAVNSWRIENPHNPSLEAAMARSRHLRGAAFAHLFGTVGRLLGIRTRGGIHASNKRHAAC